MSNKKPATRKPVNLDLEVCYSGFKVEELEYIGYSRTNENDEDDFLDTFNGKLEDGGQSGDEDEEIEQNRYGSEQSFSTDGYQSYLCSTPTAGRKHRGSFPPDADMSELTETDYVRTFPTKLVNDSGVQTQSISAANSLASIFGDENDSGASSLESLPGIYSRRAKRDTRDISQIANLRKRIELGSDLHDPYSNVDELDLSIEEEVSHLPHGNGNTSTLGTLKRRLSLKLIRRNISTGLFGSYLQQRNSALPAAPSTSSQQNLIHDHASLLEKAPPPTGPVNLWFRKFRNRHFI